MIFGQNRQATQRFILNLAMIMIDDQPIGCDQQIGTRLTQTGYLGQREHSCECIVREIGGMVRAAQFLPEPGE